MVLSVHTRGFFIATDLPYRRTVQQLQSQIIQVRIRSHHVARQLTSLSNKKNAPGRLAIRYLPTLIGRRHLSDKPLPKDQPNIPASSSIEPQPATSIPPLPASDAVELHESPYTIPNALTLARILACPFLGYTIVEGDFAWATGILFASGVSDWLDGWLARRYNSRSVLGSILDPAADKALMTTLVGTLAWSGLLPLPLAILIFGRDLGLSISAFYFRFISLPKPRTLKRYFDVSIPSAEVKPTQISKINTALQLLLMGLTTVSPLLGYSIAIPLQALQWTVAGTTIWSGFSYIGRSGVKILQQPGKKL
ncbi:uncharacterized protein I206_100078 [Kwoniella pini CBS 10737]|uniref:Cardiolipin synthase n=1 Tax=Kwoniella pini CBS 10737 TaxID=1296096 RepID=A0A1B9HSG9_9TREE|nr:cardiolipin synthase [Kwoniella pini CBS 10737]OCF46222.1 cardiolipin synthase [Kwoniella pini CBS 10737]